MRTLYRITLTVFVFLVYFCPMMGQEYEEEIGFTFVKAKYLFDTERYDDAVREFNKVIKENPDWEDVLLLRGTAKYKLAAYIGAKKDVLKYIELKGITSDAVRMLAKAEYQLSEFDAALHSLSTAIDLIDNDPELYEFRATLLMDRDQRLKACEDWEKAASLGSSKALIAARNSCGYDPPRKVEEEIAKENPQEIEVPSYSDLNTDNEPNNREEPVSNESDMGSEGESAPVSIPEESDNEATASGEVGLPGEEPSYEDTDDDGKEQLKVDPRLLDNTFNTIEIDEDLTLIIYGQGLGRRELLRQPNILILSEEEGRVVVDVCVSRGGRILSADYNVDESTLARKSLVSLALRKAKDFWFEKSDLKEQCGKIVYKVKGI